MADQKNYGLSGIGENVEIGKKGPKLKNNNGVIEHTNNDGSDFAIVRGADPVGENDLVTKKYLESKANISVTGQIDGGSPGVGSFVGDVRVVTTAGGTYSLKELYRWDGTEWVLLNVKDGLRVSVTTSLTGGSDTYTGDHIYLYDEDTLSWLDVGPSNAISNIVRTQRKTIDFNDSDGAINIGDLIPANAIIVSTSVSVTQAFNGTNPSLEVGDSTDSDRHMAPNEICLETVGLYTTKNYHLYGANTQVIATLSKGASTQGQASLLVEFAIQ